MGKTFRKRPICDVYWYYRDQVPWRRHYKPYFKPSKWFKKLRIAKFRAQVKQALRRGRELPSNRKGDIWNWN